MEIFVTIRDGHITNRKHVGDTFRSLKDGLWRVNIKSAKKRSSKANRFYWLLLTYYVQPGLYDVGYRSIRTAEDAHEFCKNYVFPKKQLVNELTGEVVYVVPSTAEWNQDEWSEMMGVLDQWSAEYLGIALPSPNTQIPMFQ